MMLEVKKLCVEFVDLCPNFIESETQLYFAARALTVKNNVAMVKLPTGFGKSYIAFLVALYYRKKEKKFAIVTTDGFLVQ